MDLITTLTERLISFIPAAIAITAVVIALAVVNRIMQARAQAVPGRRYRGQLIIIVLSFVGLLIIILALPISETIIGQLLSLIGILLSAAIALSATTFVGNIMAGLMQRAVRNFRPGDFIRVGDYFGRVSELGLFHVEIQTEDRDLTTMPNLYLVTNPVKVTRSSGTLVTAEVSLGYDVPRGSVSEELVEAARDAGLTDPFVHVCELGDFSVVYRVAGLLSQVKSILSTRSRLRECMLDRLHQAGIEIVSPSFMNQRSLSPDQVFIPLQLRPTEPAAPESQPESIVFDKADQAESLERLQQRHAELLAQMKELQKAGDEAPDEAAKAAMKEKQRALEIRAERLAALIKDRLESGDIDAD